MNTHIRLLVIVMGLASVGGCSVDMGSLLRQGPLEETVVGGDDGFFVPYKIAIVDVDGVIVNEREKGLFSSGENPMSLFIEKLDAAADDDAVRAVIVRINSPGGGVTASDIMHKALIDFRAKRGIPAVALIQDVGASGGYYIACGADRIMAHPTSVTGSIGVIAQMLSVTATLRMIGVETKAVTSGAMKDMGSPFKPIDPKDTAVLQVMINAFYERFFTVVQDSRKDIPAADLRKLADGRVYTGPQAKAYGLIDDLGYMSDAFDLAKTLAGIDEAKLVMYDRPNGYKANAHSAVPGASPQVNMINISMGQLMDSARPRFMYIWTGAGGGE